MGEESRILLHEITRVDAVARAAEALVVLPVAATEQHGPHLPLSTDSLIVEHVARSAAERARAAIDVLVAPTLPFGSSHHHMPFGGTVSLTTERYYGALVDMVESLVEDGFRRIFILNGHGGNAEIIQLVVRDLALRHAANFGAASYWDLTRATVVEREPHLSDIFPGHAGVVETSFVLALRPDLVSGTLPRRTEEEQVRVAMPRHAYREERHGFWRSIDGYTDSPADASAALGEELLGLIVPEVAETFMRFGTLPLVGQEDH